MLESLVYVDGFSGQVIGSAAVDVQMRSQSLGDIGVLRSAPYGRHFVPELVRELNPEMPKATDPLNRDKVAGQRSAVPE